MNSDALTAQKVFAMLDNETLWTTALLCDRVLSRAEIPYAVCGGVAVCLHGYQRTTLDLDLVVRREDSAAIREALGDAGLKWMDDAKEFRTPSGIAVQFLTAGERAGRGESVKIPEPFGKDNVETIDGLAAVRLSRLIEMKLACGSANIRRTHKDFADVVELIAIRKLTGAFARHLHKSVRSTFRELVKRVQSDA